MAGERCFLGLQHWLRRAHPLRSGMTRSLRRLENATAGELLAGQERRLRALVRWAAFRSPFYRRWFEQSGLDPWSVRTVTDLHLLPLLDRDHLVSTPEDFLVYPRRLVWPAHSSGTSGSPLTTYRTPGSSVFELAVLGRQLEWFGLPHSPRRAILRGSDFAADHPSAVTRQIGGRQLLVSSFHLTQQELPRIVGSLRQFGPEVIEGWPSSVGLLAGLLHDSGQRLPVRAVVTSSEVTNAAQRALFREVFAGPVIDHYGQTERVAMAGSCEHGGYHMFPDYGIMELLPVAGRVERWEIVGTPLHNWGFPLFRYRTGDEVGPAPVGPCPCGRAFPLLGTVDGRVEDVFVSADGRPIPLPSIIIDDLVGIREGQVVQRAPGHFDIRVVPDTGSNLGDIERRARRNVDRVVGLGQTVTIRMVDRIPRTASGKLKPAILINDLGE